MPLSRTGDPDMTDERFKQRRAELERELEQYLEESDMDPEVTEMLVSLRGD